MAKLKVAMYVALHKLVQEEFTASGKNDIDFAAYAAGKLNAPITHWHILECRKTYGIPSLKAVGMINRDQMVVQRITALEEAVAEMKAKWAQLEGK